MSRLRRLPLWTCAAMLALVPVVTGNLSGLGIGSQTLLYDAIALPRLAVALVLTAAAWSLWLFAAWREGTAVRFDAGWALVTLLSAWAVLSSAVSPHRLLSVVGQSERLEGAVTVVLYALLYGLGLQVARRIADARLLVGAFGVAATALSVLGLLQYAGLDPTSYSFESYAFDLRRAFGTLGNPNFLAGVLVLALPMLVALSVESRRTAVRVAWGVGAIAAAAALFATFTRGAWLAAAIEGAVALIVWWRRRRSGARPGARWLLVAASVVLAVLLAFSAFAPAERNVLSRVSEAFRPTDSAKERELGAGIALEAAQRRPLTGYGPDTFLPAFRLYRSDAYAAAFGPAMTLNNAHSWPLQYAATLGFPGALLLVASLLVPLVGARRTVGGRGDADASVLMTAIWIAALGFIVHMLFNVAVLAATVPFWLLLGALGAPDAKEAGAKTRAVLAAAVLAGVVAVAVALASVSAIAADAAYLRSRLAFLGGDDATALALARRARALDPLSVKYARGAAEVAADEVAAAIARREDAATVRSLYERAAREFAFALERDPEDYAGRAWLAALQVRAGVYLGEEDLLRRGRLSAVAAAELDRQHAEVAALAAGDTSRAAIGRAASVPRLP